MSLITKLKRYTLYKYLLKKYIYSYKVNKSFWDCRINRFWYFIWIIIGIQLLWLDVYYLNI